MCEWQVKLCDPLVTHGPYLSALEIGITKRCINSLSLLFSERELMFMFAICRRPSVCLSVCRMSVTFVHRTQPIKIFGNVSAPCNTLVI